jgi:hypothetical protein
MKIFLAEDPTPKAVGTVRRERSDYAKAILTGLGSGVPPALLSGHPEAVFLTVPAAMLTDLTARPRVRANHERKTGIRTD